MRLGRQIARSRLASTVFCWVLAQYIRLVHRTTRWQINGRESANALIADGRPFIAAFWHGRLMMAAPGWRERRPITVMISRHRDGEMIARSVRHLGVEAIRGSGSRGGATAFRGCLRVIRGGGYVGITPDGPRGPRMRAQPGIVTLARRAGVPIVPATYAVSRRKLLRSWDRFVVALPFGRGVYLWGEPIVVPCDADETEEEAVRIRLEATLNELTARADRLVGVDPVEPAPALPRVAPAERPPTALAAGSR